MKKPTKTEAKWIAAKLKERNKDVQKDLGKAPFKDQIHFILLIYWGAFGRK